MYRHRIVTACFVLLALVAAVTTSNSVVFASRSETNPNPKGPHLSLKPGQSGSLLIAINPKPTNPYELAELELIGANSVPLPGEQNTR